MKNVLTKILKTTEVKTIISKICKITFDTI